MSESSWRLAGLTKSLEFDKERDGKIEKYKLVFLLDIVAMGADEATKEEILSVAREYVPLHAHRISSKALGEHQTDSLAKSFEWVQLHLAEFVSGDIIGSFVFRADCYLKPMVALQSWVERGIENDRCVFPFMVWEGRHQINCSSYQRAGARSLQNVSSNSQVCLYIR